MPNKAKIVSGKHEVEHMPCDKCGCKNKTIDGTVYRNDVIGFTSKCCKCGHVTKYHRRRYGRRKMKNIAASSKHIRYGAVRCSTCHRIHKCILYREGRCICVEQKRRHMPKHVPYIETVHFHEKTVPASLVTVKQIDNPKYK